MKKNILFILIIAQVSFVTAQSFIVSGDTIVSGEANTQIEHHLDVKNISGNTINVVCQKTNITLPLGMPDWAGSSYCFAGTCYLSTSTNPSNSAALASGQAFAYADNDTLCSGASCAHSGYFNTGDKAVTGIATVQYCFYDENNPADETCVVVTYNINKPTAIDDYQPLTKSGDFYPNPASEKVYFTFNGNSATLKLIDILGNNVKEILLTQVGVQELDLSDMNKGIYFGNLIVKGEVVSIKKLIVK